MSSTTRRNVLAAAGAGVATGAIGITARPASAAPARTSADSAHESVVAYIKDHHAAELRLMVGEREVVVHNRDLVTRILNAAGGK